ncbi:MAG: glycosyltransferase, partial [Candidatus Latescibacteria bacterium]|nr:glycosyltransferase [Candidatus Latescibacterota bacterium]NIO77442.1 glycosyltransferase [Candidatus Latescibacterota bacterium]
AAADLFVAPSVEGAWGETEGQGVVLLEAFAAHLCVVATRVGGIGEVITDGITGILVEPSNPHQLATVMSKL